MPFPQVERVIYERAPLVEVICQLRFAPNLRIEAELPAEFQEEIRGTYPGYGRREQSLLADAPPAIQSIASVFGAPSSESIKHDFSSENGVWTVSLARDFVSLVTKDYPRWEEFRGRITEVVHAAVREYEPAHFTRVGLRYRDLITRSELGLKGEPWAALLRPQIASELGDPAIDEASVEIAIRQIVFRPGDESESIKVGLRHGLIEVEDHGEPDELSYLIDADFYSEEQSDAEGALGLLERAHDHAAGLWRWCITDRLHNALEPRAADS